MAIKFAKGRELKVFLILEDIEKIYSNTYYGAANISIIMNSHKWTLHNTYGEQYMTCPCSAIYKSDELIISKGGIMCELTELDHMVMDIIC